MIISSPRPTDCDAIAALYNKAIVPFYAIYSDEERAAFTLTEDGASIAEQMTHKSMLCVRDDDDVVIGYTSFRAKNATTIWISDLYVDPACQKRGIGGLLLSAIEKFARQHAHQVVALETHAKADWAIAFYLKHGFEIVNDRMTEKPFDEILDKPPVAGRPVFAKRV